MKDRNTWITSAVFKQMSSGYFRNVFNKICVYKSYIYIAIYIHIHIYIYIYICVCVCVCVCLCKRADCVKKGWICHVIPIEVGCRGFLGHSVISFLTKIGITVHSLKVASNHLQTTAQYALRWIWSKVRSFQHEWNARGTTIPVWLCNIKKTVTVNA